MDSKNIMTKLTAQPMIGDLPVEAAQSVIALRYAILCRRCGHDPLPELERRWGHILAARRFRLVVEAIAQIWPDPFAVAPPCCRRVSFDEALLATAVTATARGDRADFDYHTAEMLDSDARDLLYGALTAFLRARQAASAGTATQQRD